MKLIVTAICLLTLFAGGCVSIKPGYYSDDKKRAMNAVSDYHNAYNRQAYNEIFESSHPDAKATKSKEKLAQVLADLHSQLGKVVDNTLIRADVSTVSIKERQVEMVFKTRFENGERNEVFLMVSDDDLARLHSFGIATDEELKNAEQR